MPQSPYPYLSIFHLYNINQVGKNLCINGLPEGDYVLHIGNAFSAPIKFDSDGDIIVDTSMIMYTNYTIESCYKAVEFTIEKPNPINLSYKYEQTGCPQDKDGLGVTTKIILEATGGTPPYFYAISDVVETSFSSIVANFTNKAISKNGDFIIADADIAFIENDISVGSKNLYVFDSNGCKKSINGIVLSNEVSKYDITNWYLNSSNGNAFCPYDCKGFISVDIINGNRDLLEARGPYNITIHKTNILSHDSTNTWNENTATLSLTGDKITQSTEIVQSISEKCDEMCGYSSSFYNLCGSDLQKDSGVYWIVDVKDKYGCNLYSNETGNLKYETIKLGDNYQEPKVVYYATRPSCPDCCDGNIAIFVFNWSQYSTNLSSASSKCFEDTIYYQWGLKSIEGNDIINTQTPYISDNNKYKFNDVMTFDIINNNLSSVSTYTPADNVGLEVYYRDLCAGQYTFYSKNGCCPLEVMINIPSQDTITIG